MITEFFEKLLAKHRQSHKIRELIANIQRAIKEKESLAVCPYCGEKKVSFYLNNEGLLQSANCPNNCLKDLIFN